MYLVIPHIEIMGYFFIHLWRIIMRKFLMMFVAVIVLLTLVGCGETVIDDVSVTVEYVDFDGIILQTQEYEIGSNLSGLTAPSDPERNGYTFDSWSGTVPAILGEETVTLTAMYTINQYTVEYVDYDGTVFQTEDYDFGVDLTGVTTPADPERVGYTFDSWSGTVPATMGTTKVTITATYTINQYTISYNLDGGINDLDNIATYNIEDSTFTLLEATKDEGTFVGWYDTSDFSGSVVTEISIGSYGDITLYAKWDMNEYIVEYIDFDGRVLQTNSYDYGTNLKSSTAPRNPTRAGYTFDGWSGTVPATMGTTKVTITATYTINQYTITFNSNGGSSVSAITQDYDTAVTEPVDPTKTDYKYVAEVWCAGAKVHTMRTYPNPTNNRGIFDTAAIVRESITPTLTTDLGVGEWWINVQVKIREEYNGTVGAIVATSTEKIFFNHYNGRVDTLTGLSSYTNKVLSNRPTTIYMPSGCATFYLPYFAASASSFNVVINGSTTAVTPAAANSLININIAIAIIK